MDEAELNRRLSNMESLLGKIFKVLNGNGNEGLVTTVALHSQKIEDIPKPTQLKWYAGIGGGIATSFGLLCWLIYYLIRSAFTNGG